MNTYPIKASAILPRLDGIARDIAKLKKLGGKPLPEFEKDEDTFCLALFHLRQALEGVFHMGTHILSRLPGGRSTEYKEIARQLGKQGIVDTSFANQKLVTMAGYRNRITHFYAEITPAEVYKIIQQDLGDFETFMQTIRKILDNPQAFGLEIEP